MIIPLALAAAAAINVPFHARPVLRDARHGGVPVLLPSRMNLDYKGRVYATGGGGNDQYAISFAGSPTCEGANACFLASFTGEEGAALGFRPNVRLANGVRGAYKPLTCGASCSPPMISFKQRGVVYRIQAKALGGRKAFVSMANSAIRHGGR